MAIITDLSSQEVDIDLCVKMFLFFHFLFETTACYVRRNQRVTMGVVVNVCFRRTKVEAGSCHDSWVWQRNPLRARLAAQLRPGECLLGDSAYPLEPWLLTPVLGDPDDSTREGQYNREHRSMRNVVERCIGVLKSKFRCLQHFRTMLYSPERAARIIYACAALHNIALDSGDRTLDELGGGVPPPEQPEEPGGGQALQPCDVLLRGRLQRSAVVNLF
ncbi:hypothetical protein HPB50_028175 [Hyalomma asiaticum]|nr:hypothetical protein HPB50_028175 [Hyalomma asiaticum]